MIKRIVKLEIKPNKVDEFKQFFENNKSQILTFDGCESVTLLQDVNDDCTFFTHSFWKSENHQILTGILIFLILFGVK